MERGRGGIGVDSALAQITGGTESHRYVAAGAASICVTRWYERFIAKVHFKNLRIIRIRIDRRCAEQQTIDPKEFTMSISGVGTIRRYTRNGHGISTVISKDLSIRY